MIDQRAFRVPTPEEVEATMLKGVADAGITLSATARNIIRLMAALEHDILTAITSSGKPESKPERRGFEFL